MAKLMGSALMLPWLGYSVWQSWWGIPPWSHYFIWILLSRPEWERFFYWPGRSKLLCYDCLRRGPSVRSWGQPLEYKGGHSWEPVRSQGLWWYHHKELKFCQQPEWAGKQMLSHTSFLIPRWPGWYPDYSPWDQEQRTQYIALDF